jgi:hypothetical protein
MTFAKIMCDDTYYWELTVDDPILSTVDRKDGQAGLQGHKTILTQFQNHQSIPATNVWQDLIPPDTPPLPFRTQSRPHLLLLP